MITPWAVKINEEDHDHAVGGEDLIVVVRRKETFGTIESDGLLGTHHEGIGKATQKHDNCQNDVHDADLFMVDRRDPLAPEVSPQTEVGQTTDNGDATHNHTQKRHKNDRIMEKREGVEGQPAKYKM